VCTPVTIGPLAAEADAGTAPATATAAAGTTSAATAERKLSLFKAFPSEDEWPGRS
jgi:hypothetical protein